jgi:hypothetical protein
LLKALGGKSGSAAKKPTQLRSVEAVPAHDGPVEEQDGYIEPVASQELGVLVHIDDIHRRQGERPSEHLQLGNHLIA